METLSLQRAGQDGQDGSGQDSTWAEKYGCREFEDGP